MSNLNELRPIQALSPFKRFCCTIGNLPSSYVESMSYMELVYWLCDYLKNTVIPAVNNNANAVLELQNLYVELKNYVDNYLNNLDLQQDINNKLDEMAQNDELATIIAQFLNYNSILVFDNVEELKQSTNLQNGCVAKTLGFYEKNDGGSATYIITNDENIQVDGFFVHLLNNNLKANMLIEDNKVSILQIGGRYQKNNNHYDIKLYVDAYINKINNQTHKFTLFLPYGIYYTSPININAIGFKIIGESTEYGSTIISAIDNQPYVLKVGDYTRGCGYYTIDGITFSSAIYTDYITILSYNTVDTCVILSYTYFLTAHYLQFANIKGQALKMDTAWELWVDKMNFSNIYAFNSAALVFDTCNTQVQMGVGNLSDSNFDYIRFEQIIGDCIHFKYDNKCVNLHFGTINVEPSRVSEMGIPYNEVTGNEEFEQINCIIKLFGNAVFSVDTIEANNFYYRYYTINNKKYAFGDFIQIAQTELLYSILINFVCLHFARNMDCCLLKSFATRDNYYSKIIFNNILNNANHNLKIDARLCGQIVVKDNLAGRNNANNSISYYGKAIPCYKNAIFSNLTSFGTITYDEKSINPEKLVISAHEEMTGIGKRLFAFICGDTSLRIRAKIPDGVSLPVSAYWNNNGSWENLIPNTNLIGTGDYEFYDLTLNNNNAIGNIVYFQLANDNEHHYAKFDVYVN